MQLVLGSFIQQWECTACNQVPLELNDTVVLIIDMCNHQFSDLVTVKVNPIFLREIERIRLPTTNYNVDSRQLQPHVVPNHRLRRWFTKCGERTSNDAPSIEERKHWTRSGGTPIPSMVTSSPYLRTHS